MNVILPALTALLALCGLTVFLIAPGKASKRMKAPFYGRNIAHRGLHKEDQSIPENSLAAFRLAAENGYGIELDVQLTADNEVVVFHDDTLERVCGLEGKLSDFSWGELRSLRLCGTNERIPLLSEVFEAVGQRVPVIVELKRGPRNELLCKKTLAIMDRCRPTVCIESFDPFIVRWFWKNAPDILRGQLSSQREDLEESTGKLGAFCLSHLLSNFLCRPQFIAYRIGKKPLTVRLSEAMGAMKVLWTSRNWESESVADAVIFEHYRPRRKFK